MDLLASTSSVVEIVANTIGCIERYATYQQTCNNSDQSLAGSSLLVLCQSILVALHQVKKVLRSHDSHIPLVSSREDVTSQSLSSVLVSCQVTFKILLDRMQPALPFAQGEASSSSGKTTDLWPLSDIESLAQNISTIASGLQLLVQALNLKLAVDAERLLGEERNSMLFADINDDTVVDALESRPNSTVPSLSRTVSKSSMTNRASLAMIRLVYRELVDNRADNSLNFLTTEDADFVQAAHEASKESEEQMPFSIGISGKQIEYIPDHWIELISTQIQRLRIANCPITVLPSNLSLCRNITLLSLSQLKLTEISRPIFDLRNLEVLDLSCNPITVIPSEILNLSQLILLHIQDCLIACLPLEIFALENLLLLRALRNPLTNPPRTLYQDIFYAAARMDAKDNLDNADRKATRHLKSYHRESRFLIHYQPELDGSQTVFCAGCSSIGFWHDNCFILVMELFEHYNTYYRLWQTELLKKVQCNNCSLGLDALLILGDEIICSCTPHFEDEKCWY